jgi:hypothetical protein
VSTLMELTPDNRGIRKNLPEELPPTFEVEWNQYAVRLRDATGSVDATFDAFEMIVLRLAARVANLEAHVAAIEEAGK